MPQTPDNRQSPSDTELAHQPNEGSSVRGRADPAEARSYQGDGGSAPGQDRQADYGADGDEPEIAADDAGASAMAERAARQAGEA